MLVTFARKNQASLFVSDLGEARLFSLKKFLDGEVNLELNFKPASSMSLFWQFDYSMPINEQVCELLMTCSIFSRMGSKIKLLLPYFPYSRQDETIDGLDSGLFVDFTNLLSCSGVDWVVSLDMHNPSIISDSKVKINNIGSEEFWAEYIDNDTVLVSPDEGGKKRVENLAQLVSAKSAYIEKKRVGDDKSVALALHGDVANKKVVLIDDILDTATTATNACDMLLENGALSVLGCFTHGVFSGDAYEKIESSGFEKVFVTDTIVNASRGKVKLVSISKFFAKYI